MCRSTYQKTPRFSNVILVFGTRRELCRQRDAAVEHCGDKGMVALEKRASTVLTISSFETAHLVTISHYIAKVTLEEFQAR